MKHGLVWLSWRIVILLQLFAPTSPQIIGQESNANRSDVEEKGSEAWGPFYRALMKFHVGGPRDDFYAACKANLVEYPESPYANQIRSLLTAMDKESKQPQLDFLDKSPEARTQDEEIRYWVYMLREHAGVQVSQPGHANYFSREPLVDPAPTDQLVAIGPPAIPYLVAAVDDETPTRTLSFERGYFPYRNVVRRQDLAMACLERIVGCDFYLVRGSGGTMQTDDSKRSRSAIRHVREWWERSQGATQAEMIRNQLALFDSNLSLAGHGDLYRIRSLASLAMLEGPESVIDETLNIAETLERGTKLLLMVDPGAVLNAPKNRFAGNLLMDRDDRLPSRDGDWAMSDEELAARVAAIESDHRSLRIEVIKDKSVRHYRTQRAILNSLQKPGADASEQVLLLENLLQNPWPWHFPVLAQLLEQDGDMKVRILAARCMHESLRGGRPYSDFTRDARLETNERGFAAARQVVQNDQNPESLRFAALDVLLRSRLQTDLALVRRLGESAAFDAHRGLTYRFEREPKVRQLLKKQHQWMQSRVPASPP